MKNNYFYPTELSQIKDGDLYQIKIHPRYELWDREKKFNSNICDCKKSNFKHLIKYKRLRILI